MASHFDLAPAEWSRLKQLLGEALDVPANERDAWVDALEGDDAVFKPRLRSLLAHVTATGALPLDTLPKVETAEFAGRRRDDAGLQAGAAVGPYRLLRPLGEGGMGEVWLAERGDMLQRRQVALKLPRLLAGRAHLAERLAREREILASLEHPQIARLYDAGVAAGGQPYLALEYVEGERIDAWCGRLPRAPIETLRLFLQVAHAVAHAHAKLVVHRDLKPSNILVTAAGEVKLLDFGIAKLLSDGRAQETELTQLGGRALTPEYAAPEQILGQPIGTAADIYALGVVLFELLTGQRPYRLKRDSRAALEEAIVQADVPRPSSMVADAKLKRRLRGDLDTILLKALKKAPAERYSSVEALAADIERFLDRRPVLARPDSRVYRLHKFVARNRLAVGAATAVLAAVVGGASVALWQAQMAWTEQQRAEEVKRFVTSLFADADPFATGSGELTVEALLQTAESRTQTSIGANSALRVELLDMIGRSLIGLGKFDRAEAVLGRAIDEGRRALGPEHPLTVRARIAMTSVHRFRGQQAQMKSELSSLLPVLRAGSDAYREELFGAVMNSAHLAIDEGRHADAQAAAREALAMARRLFGNAHSETANAALLVAGADTFGTDAGTALDSAVTARELLIAVHGAERPHARVLDGRFVYARALAKVGRYEGAVRELKVVKRDTQAMLGATAPMAGFVAADIARFQLELGAAADALPHIEESLAILAGVAQEDSFTIAAARLYLGRAQLATLKFDDAARTFEQARASMRKARGPDSAEVADLTAHRAYALAHGGSLAEALREIAPALARMRESPPNLKQRSLHVVGVVHRLAGATDAAADLQREALNSAPETPVNAYQRARIRAELARLAVDSGQSEQALALLDGSPLREMTSEPIAPEAAEWILTRGRAALALGRADEALADIERAAAFWRTHAPDSRWAGEASYWLGRCYAALGREVDARLALTRAAKLLARSPFPADAALLKRTRVG